jgi:Outer membrane protein beta-barrel domain
MPNGHKSATAGKAAAVILLLALAVLVVAPARAGAQSAAPGVSGVNIVPWAGVYMPTRNRISDVPSAAFKRDVSVIGGARLTFWGTGIVGIEATGGYAPAKIEGETINEKKTNLGLASVRLLLALSPVTNPVGFYVGAGPAFLARGKNPLDDDRSKTNAGGTVGAGLRFGLGESGRSAIRVDFEDYLYNGDFGGGDKFQNDLVASLGLSIGLGGTVR